VFGGDPLYYHSGAKLLARGDGLINPYAYVRHRTVQAADHPPLYLIYLAAFSVFGMTSITWHLMASALLGSASIVIAGLTGREIAGPRAGVVAAAAVAFYPNTWRYDGMLLSETMVIFVVLVALWVAYRYWHRPSMGRLAVVGLAVGLGTLARSELILLTVFLILPLALLVPGRPWGERFRWLGMGAVGFLAVVGPWVAFNLVRFDHTVVLSENLGGTLATSNCDEVYYGDKLGFWHYPCGDRILASHGIGPYEFKGASDRYLRQDAIAYIRSHARRVPVVIAARVGRITGLYRPRQEASFDVYLENFPKWVSDLGLWTYYPMVLAAIVGGVILRRRRQAVFPLLAPVFTVLATCALFYAATRFRATAEPALCLLAAVAVDAAIGAVRRRGRTPVEPTAVAA
jgi:4-amino-4-deoxy-L-arabinose transferase-like glycosyltransferase